MQRILFVCGKNRRRSPTAESLYAGREGLEVSSAGTAADAECPLSSDLVEWADVVVVMERRHEKQLTQKFRQYLLRKRVVCLSIPDEFEYMQPELMNMLRDRESRWLR